MEAVKEHAQGPYSSTTLPTIEADGYWPIIPLEQFKKGKYSGKLKISQKGNGGQLWL